MTVATPVQEVPATAVSFPDARGRRSSLLAIEVIRVLEPGDLQALGQAVAAKPQRLTQIRHAHHQLASLICQGLELQEVALMTGYQANYISMLQTDPAFQDLLAHYSTQRELAIGEAFERLKTLGIMSANELLARVTEQPEKFSNRELQELMELGILKPEIAKAQSKALAAPANGPAISINFVNSGPKTIDITPRAAE